MNRRSFLTGLIAAPIVVRSGVLMPLRGIVMAQETEQAFIFYDWNAGERVRITIYPQFDLDSLKRCGSIRYREVLYQWSL